MALVLERVESLTRKERKQGGLGSMLYIATGLGGFTVLCVCVWSLTLKTACLAQVLLLVGHHVLASPINFRNSGLAKRAEP